MSAAWPGDAPSPASTPAPAGLSVRGLHVQHPGMAAPALDSVDFDVPRGTLAALIGPSGCGKSTVLRTIAGLLRPQAGRVLLDGRDLAGVLPEARQVALTFQQGGLFPHLSVRDNVLFPLQAAGVPAAEGNRRADGILQRMELAAAAARRPGELSGGEQQRVALARALAQAPAVLLLDEPLSGVEPRLRRALREEIRALQQGLGLTAVYVTHDRHEALAVSDQVVLMDAGRVVQAGTPQQLYEAPAHAFSAAFMGEATVLAGRRDGEGRVCIGPLQLPRLHPGPAGPVQVAVRPEAWRLHPCHAPGLPGTVTRRRYLGRAMEYLLATPAGPVLVHAAQTRRWHEVGAPLSLGLAPRGAWVLA